MHPLADWGWNPAHERAFEALGADGLVPARVVEQQRDVHVVVGPAGPQRARPAGRLRHHARAPEDLPAVGDWVAATVAGPQETAVIHDVLPRTSLLVRKEAGRTVAAQVVAANVDRVFLVTSLNADLEPRRIERYLAAIWESGADPVLVLNKADLAAAPEEQAAALGPIAVGVPVLVVSALHDRGLDALRAFLEPRRTVLLVGSSGVGKSTLVNRLAGEALQHVHVVRERDARGQHTTTARRLLRLACGALLVDTPGMRELGLWNADEGLEEAFRDVTGLVGRCRFGDCRHETEPGCAVKAAIEAGTLDAERLEAWRKLQRELAWMRTKQDARAAREQQQAWRRITRSHRARTQALKRRRGLP